MDEPKTPQSIPASTLDELREAIRLYPPEAVLRHCHKWACEFIENHNQIISRNIPTQLDRWRIGRTILIAPFHIALIARWSLLYGHKLMYGQLRENDFIRIVQIVLDLDEAISDPQQFFAQTSYEQLPLQASLKATLARAITMYKMAWRAAVRNKRKYRITHVFTLREFKRQFCISVDDFLILSFCFFALFSEARNSTLNPCKSKMRIPALIPKMTSQNVRAWLTLMSADEREFRAGEECRRIPPINAEGRYALNPLVRFPLVCTAPDRYVAPLPQLILHRAYFAPYWELRQTHRRSGKKNSFASFFGFVFQEYVGLLLRHALGRGNVFSSDMPYRTKRGETRGPDWIALLGREAIAIECTMSPVTETVMSEHSSKSLRKDIAKKYEKKIRDLPGKVEYMKENHLLPAKYLAVQKWHYAVVSMETFARIEMVCHQLFPPRLHTRHFYHILDISEFEELLALHSKYGVGRSLAEREAHFGKAGIHDFGNYLRDVARRANLKLSNPLLNSVFDEWITKMRGAEPDGRGLKLTSPPS